MNQSITDLVAGAFTLVAVEARSKSFVKTDASATAQTIAANGAVPDAGKFEKNLLASANAELKAVQKAQAACRTYLYNHTTPYTTGAGTLQKGKRLLPNNKAMEFMQGFAELQVAFNTAFKDFKAVYDQRRIQALQALGSMANANDYPDASELEQYFSVELSIEPVPAAAQLPDSLPAAMLETAANELADRQVASINNAIADTRERLGEELVRMAGVLSRHAQGEKTKLYGSLLDNMRTVTDLLEATNVGNDPVLAGVVTEVREALVPKGRTIDDYKMSRGLAEEASETANKIATKLNTAAIGKVTTTTTVAAPSQPEPEPAPSVQEQFDEVFDNDDDTPAEPAQPLLPDFDDMF